MVISNPKEASNQRQFLLGCHISWTDILRNRQRYELHSSLRERLAETKDDPEGQHIKEAMALLDEEIKQWFFI